jgi:co-chaperonin GroES (HSP10)
MKVLGDRILAREIPYEHVGKIALPEKSRMDFQLSRPRVFRVLQVGTGRMSRKGVLLPIECDPGDRVIVHSEHEGPIEAPGGLHVIEGRTILAVLPKPEWADNNAVLDSKL